MAKRRSVRGVDSPSPRAALGWALRILPAGLLLIGGVIAHQAVETYLIEEPRFRLGSAEEYGQADADIRVSGIQHASESRVRQVFREDTGRSLYLLPVAERRRRLLAIDWVKDASVARIWPNRVDVAITERRPVAFVALARGNGRRGRVALIDEDGVILEQPAQSQYDLPVLTGIGEEQSEQMRAGRIHGVLRLLEDVGPLGEQISEIDVADPNNLKVTQSVAGNAVVLLLGRENFRARIENFRAHYAEIQRRVPAATTFDLRLDDRITAVDGVKRGG